MTTLTTEAIDAHALKDFGDFTAQALHPWIATEDALSVAQCALRTPMTMLPRLSARVGAEALQRQALRILAECALPPRDLPESALSRAVGGGHVGQMHVWPEGRRFEYATREVGYALAQWLRGQAGA